MKFALKTFLLLLISCMPALAFAEGVFDVPATDKSMQYLGMVFGTVGGLPIQSTGNPFFSYLIYYFNQVVFALAIMLVVILTVVGTVTTAQEGEVLGKKWSTILIPARAGLGMYLLLPTANNYNWIQLAVMWFIVQGVGAANALWNQIIYSNAIEGGLNADTREADLQNSAQAVSIIFTNVLCMQMINNKMLTDPHITEQIQEPISAFRNAAGDQIQFGRASRPEEKPLCGYITVPAVGGTVARLTSGQSVEQRRQIMEDAIFNAQGTLILSAEEAAMLPSDDWQNAENFVTAARELEGAVKGLTQTFTSLSEVHQQAIQDGWFFAGSYYFQIVTGGVYSDINVTVGGGAMDTEGLTELLGSQAAGELATEISSKANRYIEYVQGSVQATAPSDAFKGSLTPAFSPPADVQSVFAALFGSSTFSDLASSLGEQITAGCISDSTNPNAQQRDPIICMATFGADLAGTIELLFWTALMLISIIWLGTSVMSCLQPFAHTFNFMLTIIIPIVALIISLLWAAGISLALYVPLIPYLVFTFACLSWIILVVEAVVGAPLIALTLIVPSEDELGKAAHSLMLLLGIFFRPPLMMLGFIFGMKLLNVAIGMLNFGFASTLTMSIAGGVGLFGFVSIIILYVGLATALVHEAFSLIYVLPDKVLRWMGGQGEGVDVGGQAKELSGAVDKGAAMGAKGMKKGLSFAAGKAKKGLK